ncbi:YceI family protein [Desulfogranum mediterraneum]|uniref:YceI family protein n=1 Tax=Desulfogranum mediterraneum TaxID=160661 RepID=UPI0003FF8C95|nr:YceI family protein [Desulfogranum mediterraneum]
MSTHPAATQLSVEELHRWQGEERSFVLIDTLLADHFRQRHLPGAVNVCVFEVSFTRQVQALVAGKEDLVVVYGSSPRSLDGQLAAEKLVLKGYSRVFVLSGGLEAWQLAGYPLEGEGGAESGGADASGTLVHLDDGSYRIDTTASTVHWTGRNPTTSHFGTINLVRGALVVRDRLLSGSLEVEMDSLVSTSLEGSELAPVLIRHLQSYDFFHTSRYPTARLEIRPSEPLQTPYRTAPNYTINGLLELKGVKAEQQFMATLLQTPEQELLLEAHFDLDRTRWQVIYGSSRFFEHLGMHLISDLISIQLRLVGR